MKIEVKEFCYGNKFELKVEDEHFELGYIDDTNAYLTLKVMDSEQHLGCCSINEMTKRVSQIEKDLAKYLKNLKKVKTKLAKIKDSKQYKKVKELNKK